MINEEPGAFPWKEKPQVERSSDEGEIHLFPWGEIAKRFSDTLIGCSQCGRTSRDCLDHPNCPYKKEKSCPQYATFCGQPNDDDNARP